MRILLVGEYSRLHNSLKEGLLKLGHEVTLVSNGDGFKNFPNDLSYSASWTTSKMGTISRKIISKLVKFDIIKFENGLRFQKILDELTDYDVVQLINERPIQTTAKFELKLLQKLFRQNKKVFVLACGLDYLNVKYLFENSSRKNILTPLRDDSALKNEYRFLFEYTTESHKLVHDFVYQNCIGIIATDFDYIAPLIGNRKYIGLIPNPINVQKFDFIKPEISIKIVIFLGINQWNYHQKGVVYFEKALKIISEKYRENVEIIISRNIPYSDYIKSYDRCHILLDQVFASDQGYNALEAMAKGKVVFTGAEAEFVAHYNLSEKVVINAKPDVDYLVKELEFLIENPTRITAISIAARKFIEREHDYLEVAKKYLSSWQA